MRADFKVRLVAYFIDILVVSLICSIITVNMSNNSSDKYSEEINKLMNSYVNHEISTNEYFDEYKGIVYGMEKSNIKLNIIYLVVNVFYFVIFQFMNNGQSIGKKVMHIRICDKGKNKLSIFSMISRTFIINNILSGLVSILLVCFSNKSVYFIGYSIINMLCNLFIVISFIMLICSKKKNSLHDIISKTIVVYDNK